MFALNLIALASELDGFYPSTAGWIVIAIAWSIIGSLWLAGSYLRAQRASQSPGQAPNRSPKARSEWRIGEALAAKNAT